MLKSSISSFYVLTMIIYNLFYLLEGLAIGLVLVRNISNSYLVRICSVANSVRGTFNRICYGADTDQIWGRCEQNPVLIPCRREKENINSANGYLLYTYDILFFKVQEVLTLLCAKFQKTGK